MSQSLINDLLGQLQGAPLQGMAAQLGADTKTTSNAIAAALPMLVGAMSANAQRPGGADSLFGALQRDHSGAGALDMGSLLGGLLGGGQQGGGAGAAILGSLLGGGRQQGGAGALGSILGSVLGNAGAPKSRQLDAGGILGKVAGLDENNIRIQIAAVDGKAVTIQMNRQTVASVLPKGTVQFAGPAKS